MTEEQRDLMDWVETEPPTPEELRFLEIQEELQQKVLQSLGVPKEILGAGQNTNYPTRFRNGPMDCVRPFG